MKRKGYFMRIKRIVYMTILFFLPVLIEVGIYMRIFRNGDSLFGMNNFILLVILIVFNLINVGIVKFVQLLHGTLNYSVSKFWFITFLVCMGISALIMDGNIFAPIALFIAIPGFISSSIYTAGLIKYYKREEENK